MIGDWLLAMHIVGALLWLGGLIFALFLLRPSLSVLAPADRLARQRGSFRRFFLLGWHGLAIILLTGYGLLFGVYGGFANVGWNVHLMHLLGLVAAAIFIWLIFGPWAAFRAGDGPALGTVRWLVVVDLALAVITVVVAGLNG